MFRLFTLNAIISIIRFTILLFVFYLFPLFFVSLSTFMPSVGFSWYSIQIYLLGSSLQCVAETYLTSIHEDVGLIPGLLSGSGNQRCCEPWCRLWTRLRSHIAEAVVQASSCSSNSIPSLATSICYGCSRKKKKKKYIYIYIYSTLVLYLSLSNYYYWQFLEFCV